jgi:alcohol dehydrogenase (cytochrome c)
MTQDERLKSYQKSRLKEFSIVQKGLMPSFEGTLNSAQIADIVSYLATLKGEMSTSDLSRASGGESRSSTDRILRADREPQNWLTYSGTYASQRYSLLNQITRDNVKTLTLKWVWRPRYLDKMESTPIVVDGVLRGSEQRSRGARCRDRPQLLDLSVPRAAGVQRAVRDGRERARLRGRSPVLADLRWTLDCDRCEDRKGSLEQDAVRLENGLQLNVAPLVVKDKVIRPCDERVRTNCWVAAHDVHTGSEVWRFKTVPEPGEKGNDSWPGDSWKHGGAPIWVTGSHDPATNLTFWGTGNPNPGWNGGPRNPGDNLYADSVVALDADTGVLKWHYQFTPNDEFDWDSVQVPVLADIEWKGRPRKVMLWANRNGFVYVLDRVTGEFLLGKAFVKQNWNLGFDNGRPVRDPKAKPTPEGTRIEPGTQGGTNWHRLRSAPEPACSTSPPGTTTRPSRDTRTWRRGKTGRRQAAPRPALAPGRLDECQSPIGPRMKDTAPSARSIQRPATRSGTSRWWTTPRAVY